MVPMLFNDHWVICLINSVLFCWVVLFAWSKLRYIENPTDNFSTRLRWVAGIFALCLLIISTFILATVITEPGG